MGVLGSLHFVETWKMRPYGSNSIWLNKLIEGKTQNPFSNKEKGYNFVVMLIKVIDVLRINTWPTVPKYS